MNRMETRKDGSRSSREGCGLSSSDVLQVVGRYKRKTKMIKRDKNMGPGLGEPNSALGSTTRAGKGVNIEIGSKMNFSAFQAT